MASRFDNRGFNEIRKQFGRENGTELDKAHKRIGRVYLAFAKKRYTKYSRGGGAWPPLKPETIKRRRKARRGYQGQRRISILIDTGQLIRGLVPGAPGNLFERIPKGVRVGYGGTHRHKDLTGSGNGSKVTIADIAVFHDRGMGNLPKRPIIVHPDKRTEKRMFEIYKLGTGNVLSKASRRIK